MQYALGINCVTNSYCLWLIVEMNLIVHCIILQKHVTRNPQKPIHPFLNRQRTDHTKVMAVGWGSLPQRCSSSSREAPGEGGGGGGGGRREFSAYRNFFPPNDYFRFSYLTLHEKLFLAFVQISAWADSYKVSSYKKKKPCM